eukprot:Amastigsp_a678956_478.p2 type:complete len:117 gc:universal Amastigsp_a678956_478:442-792(+)
MCARRTTCGALRAPFLPQRWSSFAWRPRTRCGLGADGLRTRARTTIRPRLGSTCSLIGALCSSTTTMAQSLRCRGFSGPCSLSRSWPTSEGVRANEPREARKGAAGAVFFGHSSLS